MKYIIADVFTDTPFKGNPVAVFTNSEGLSKDQMQIIARELNLSETTFVFPPLGEGDYSVRIFTPVNELPFAGHPTLGTAFVLGYYTNNKLIKIETQMGLIPFELTRNKLGEIISVKMEQPIPRWEKYEFIDKLLEALNINKSTLPIEVYINGPRHVFVGVPTISDLSKLNPDQRILAELKDVAINCFTGSGNIWRNRMFSPAYGVSEDPATGSAAGALAVHLARHNKIKYGQNIDIFQGLEIGRPSLMKSVVTGSKNNVKKVEVSGAAVIVAKGEFIF